MFHSDTSRKLGFFDPAGIETRDPLLAQSARVIQSKYKSLRIRELYIRIYQYWKSWYYATGDVDTRGTQEGVLFDLYHLLDFFETNRLKFGLSTAMSKDKPKTIELYKIRAWMRALVLEIDNSLYGPDHNVVYTHKQNRVKIPSDLSMHVGPKNHINKCFFNAYFVGLFMCTEQLDYLLYRDPEVGFLFSMDMESVLPNSISNNIIKLEDFITRLNIALIKFRLAVMSARESSLTSDKLNTLMHDFYLLRTDGISRFDGETIVHGEQDDATLLHRWFIRIVNGLDFGLPSVITISNTVFVKDPKRRHGPDKEKLKRDFFDDPSNSAGGITDPDDQTIVGGRETIHFGVEKGSATSFGELFDNYIDDVILTDMGDIELDTLQVMLLIRGMNASVSPKDWVTIRRRQRAFVFPPFANQRDSIVGAKRHVFACSINNETEEPIAFNSPTSNEIVGDVNIPVMNVATKVVKNHKGKILAILCVSTNRIKSKLRSAEEGGHYYVYIRRPSDGKGDSWFKFNDITANYEKISGRSVDVMKREIGRFCYMCFIEVTE